MAAGHYQEGRPALHKEGSATQLGNCNTANPDIPRAEDGLSTMAKQPHHRMQLNGGFRSVLSSWWCFLPAHEIYEPHMDTALPHGLRSVPDLFNAMVDAI